MLQLELEIRSFWSRPVWDGWLNHNLCHREHRQSWAWPLFGQVWVSWWLGGWLALSASQPRLDWDNGGRVNRPINYWVSRGHELLIALSLFWLSASLHWLPSHFSPSLILLQDLVQTFQHWHAHIWGNVVCYTVILLLSHDITCVHSTYKQHAKISSLLSNSLSKGERRLWSSQLSEHRKLWLFCQRSV